MRVYFVEFFVNNETITGVIEANSQSDVWIRILKHYSDREDLILVLKEIRQIDSPYFYLHDPKEKVQ